MPIYLSTTEEVRSMYSYSSFHQILPCYSNLFSGLKHQGIFRVPGATQEIADMKRAFEEGEFDHFIHLSSERCCPSKSIATLTDI